MLQVTVEDRNSFTKVMSITVDEESVKGKFEELLKEYRKEIAIPGFRPGMAPKDLVIKKIGKVLKEETTEKIIASSFRDACKQENIEPITYPEIKNLKSEEGQPFTYEAVVEVEPKIEITKYKELLVKVEPKEVTEKDIDEVIDQVRDRMSTLKTVDRAIKEGDFAEMEYKKVIIDGKEKSDFHSPNYPVEIGKSEFLKDFEKQLVGLNKGDEKSVEFTFPEGYGYKEVAGKSAVFTVLIKDVKEKEMPALDDKFAADATPRAKSLLELREVISADLREENEQRAVQEAHDKAIDAVINENQFDVPESRIANYMAHAFDSFKRQYPYAETSIEEFTSKNREHVIKDIKRFRILEYIAEKESIKATGDEVDSEIQKIASYRREDFAKVKEALRKSGQTMEIRERIRDNKVLNMLIDYTPPIVNAEEK